MKNKFMILAVTGLMAGTLFTACERQQTKENNVQQAEEEVVRANEDLRVAQEEFRRDADLRIEANEREIAARRERVAKADAKVKSNLEKEIDRLEERNRELKAKVKDYNNDRKEDWEGFKKEFNHDMDELGQSLKDFTVNNEK